MAHIPELLLLQAIALGSFLLTLATVSYFAGEIRFAAKRVKCLLNPGEDSGSDSDSFASWSECRTPAKR